MKHFNSDRALSYDLFCRIAEFESLFSTCLTRVVAGDFDVFFNTLATQIEKFHSKYIHNESDLINCITNIKNMQSNTRVEKIYLPIMYFVKNCNLLDYFISHNNQNSRLIYSFLNNSEIKATFNDKIALFNLLSLEMKNIILDELNSLSGNSYNISDIKHFLMHINSIRFIRNVISHHNSISYVLMSETRKNIIKYRSKNFSYTKLTIKFIDSNLGRTFDFFKYDPRGTTYLYYESIHNKTRNIYDPKHHCTDKIELEKYKELFNIVINT